MSLTPPSVTRIQWYIWPNTSGARAAGVEDDELADFRKLVMAYAGLTTHRVNQLIRENDWMEICNGGQT
jgi:hypothetical protein